jgi:1,4-alpha-glucan branching enzyme
VRALRHNLLRAALAALALGACADHSRLLQNGVDVPPADLPRAAAPPDVPAPQDVVYTDVPAPQDVVHTDGSPALGATALDGAVRFRVWAPGARAARVTGDFAAADLRRGPDGVFEGVAPGARPGHAYRYALTRDGGTFARIDPRARALRDGSGVVTEEGGFAWTAPDFRAAPRRELVLYELHVGSFARAPGAAHGTFADVTARLDGLADLGVNALQLMPVNEFGSGARWGYNPQHFHAPNRAYGSPDDLRRLVDAAHARGIAVLLDLVYNHYDGWREAPLRCFDGDCDDGGAGVYFFRDPAYRSTPWGPRPDFARTEVRDYLLDGLAVWLQDYRVDGFRWDSVSNVRALDGVGVVPGGRELIVRGNALTRALRPGAVCIAEDLKGEAAITRGPSEGGFGFDAQWDGFVYVMNEVLGPSGDDGRDMGRVREAVLGRYNNDPFQRVIGTENHDTVGNGGARLPQRVDGTDPGSYAARKRSMLGAALALTVPGVPMLFMGQEHLEVGTFASTPTPLDWSRETAHARVRAFYRALIRLRRDLDGVSAGLLGANVAITHFSDDNKVLAFRRWDRGGDDVVVIANLRDRRYTRYDIGLPAGGTWRVRLDTDDPRWSTDFRGPAPTTVEAAARSYDGLPFAGSVVLGPWSVVVLSRGG